MVDFSGKTIFILGSLYNKGNLFLINLFKPGSKGLKSVKNEVTLKSILTLAFRAIPLEILATSENCLLILCGLYPLAIKYCCYSLLLILNLLSVSQIRLHFLEPFRYFSWEKICANFMVLDTTFKCTAAGKYYKFKRTLSRNRVNVVYLITC